MVGKTHLPGHLDSVRTKLRPKHQLLVLKCYPRLPKNSAADVKPNGSELSYLLYYASTRRSKLQKVGSFLERKTASDVYKNQSARTLVTLHILTALLESKAVGAGAGFALIAPYVLRIIREILTNTNDISLIEASLDTWNVFCRDQEEAMLKADHEYRELYEDVVQRYAGLARKDGAKKLGKTARSVAVQDAIRMREAGLGAIKSILLSDSLASENGRQFELIVPAILSNMRGEDGAYLEHLVRLSKRNEEDEKDKATARRMSMATVRTYTNATETSFEVDPRQAEGTVQDADALAEEEAAASALACLKAAFSTENRPQIRSAVSAVLRYIRDTHTSKPTTRASERGTASESSGASWATKLFEICTAWTPVQERFILVVTAVEALVRLPLKESNLQLHLLYTNLVDHVLRSDLNLIGLSIMDVLLSLIQQILRVLQLSGPRVAGRSSAAQIFSSDEDIRHPATPTSADPSNDLPSEARMRLTERLKHCIADLATHVYYTDQISDMLAALLLRLKPNPSPTGPQNPSVTAAAIEEPKAAVMEVASNVSLSARERSNSTASSYFSFDTARQIALEAARDMLTVANSAQSLTTGGIGARSKVPIDVWEGTQWLLRDPALAVRKAYVEAFATWLQLETKPSDVRISEAKVKMKKKLDGTSARRAISNASQRKAKQGKRATVTFLQLLHLSIYDHANESAATRSLDGEKEILMIHFLLTTLVEHLGINAAMHGLPMVMALQTDVGAMDEAFAKVRMTSLVHGYLWTLADFYDFDASSVGQEVFGEIRRRRDAGLWLNEISVPPKPLEQVLSAPNSTTSTDYDSTISEDSLRLFEDREILIDDIATAYSATVTSPPASTPGSPGRSPGRPVSSMINGLERSNTSYLTAKQPGASILPESARQTLATIWSKESCLAAIAAAAPKSVSASDSRSSPSRAVLGAGMPHRQLLAAANSGPMNPGGTAAQQRQQPYGSRLNSQSPARRQSAGNGSQNGFGSPADSVRGPVRVEDLKRVLAGEVGGSVLLTTGLIGSLGRGGDDTASESLIDVEGEDMGSESEVHSAAAGGFVTPPQTASEAAAFDERRKVDSIPAVPPIPSDFSAAAAPVLSLEPGVVTGGNLSNNVRPATAGQAAANGGVSSKGRPHSRAGGTPSVKSAHRTGQARRELAALLLAGIGNGKEEEVRGSGLVGGMGRPPY